MLGRKKKVKAEKPEPEPEVSEAVGMTEPTDGLCRCGRPVAPGESGCLDHK